MTTDLRRESADADFRGAFTKVKTQLGELDVLVTKHSMDRFVDPLNRGYIGSLGHVSELLDELIAFLGGRDVPTGDAVARTLPPTL